jgi:hypothetical protein
MNVKICLAERFWVIGSNFSAGEKQLLALCRALVKNSRVIVLVRLCPLMWGFNTDSRRDQDEATSSVDVETDAKLQRTIQAEFTQSTLLCIAHRLNTIGMYPTHRREKRLTKVHGQHTTTGFWLWTKVEWLSLTQCSTYSTRKIRSSARFVTKLSFSERISFAFAPRIRGHDGSRQTPLIPCIEMFPHRLQIP